MEKLIEEEIKSVFLECSKQNLLNEEAIKIINTIAQRIYVTYKYDNKERAERCFNNGILNIKNNWQSIFESKYEIIPIFTELYKRGAFHVIIYHMMI